MNGSKHEHENTPDILVKYMQCAKMCEKAIKLKHASSFSTGNNILFYFETNDSTK